MHTTPIKQLFTLALGLCALMSSSSILPAAEPDSRCFELRTYYAAEGKLDDLNARFRQHTCALFTKHGMENIGYWMPIENPDHQLIYLLAFPSRAARDQSWKAFGSDPEWQKVVKTSEAHGRLVTKVESRLLTATDFSPAVRTALKNPERVFELRTYTASPGNLGALDSRFRDHTVALFRKHGMENFGYWHLLPGQKGADETLVYLLAHASKEAGDASFKAFREDPDWVAARKASEEKAGGSLTAKDGVKSVFLKPMDYSQTK